MQITDVAIATQHWVQVMHSAANAQNQTTSMESTLKKIILSAFVGEWVAPY